MSTAKVTYHDVNNPPRYGPGGVMGVLPDQIGDRVHVTFTSTPGYGAAQGDETIAAVLADADCGIAAVALGSSVTLAKTRPVKAGATETIRLRSGQRLAIIADADVIT